MSVKIKYYDDDPNKGIIYDWDFIRKQYKKLHCPEGVWNPLKADWSRCGYSMAISDRSQGKTTNPLLIGMIMHEHYGTITHYIRQTSTICEPMMIKNIFDTILSFNYISKITGDRWNNLYYRGKRWYYCNTDDQGTIIEKCPQHFMICFGLDESQQLKSSYNCPVGDLIIFDEFITDYYGYYDYVHWVDICKTIIRDRYSPCIYMLSNNIDLNSPWFDEMELRDAVDGMTQGQSIYASTTQGTVYHIEILPQNITEQREKVNKRFFGFSNPKIAAVTGRGSWATDHYQHIPKDQDDDQDTRVLFRRLYMLQSGKYLRLNLMYQREIGYCVYVHPATRIYEDSIILTHGDIPDRRHVYGFGPADSKLLQLYWRLYKGNRWYYHHNASGAMVKSYVSMVQTKNKDKGFA